MNQYLKILYLTPELSPFSRSGLQGDIAAAIPRSVKRLGHDVRVITPRYRMVLERRHGLRDAARLRSVEFTIQSRKYSFSVKSGFIPQSKVQVYFLEKPDYYYLDGLYVHPRTGVAYENNAQRFSFLCHAALQLMLHLQWIPQIIHCHDWPTSLTPYLTTSHPAYKKHFQNSRTVLQLNWHEQLKLLSSNPSPVGEHASSEDDAWVQRRTESFLRAGIEKADHILFKTPFPDDGESASELNEGRDSLAGLNARSSYFCEREDCWEWNPVTDSWLTHNYCESDFAAGKAANKRALQRELNLKNIPEAPLGVIAFDAKDSRALGMMKAVKDKLSLAPTQWIVSEVNGGILPSPVEEWRAGCPERIAVISGQRENLIRRAYAAGDIYLMLCGLERLEQDLKPALHYGVMPLLPAQPTAACGSLRCLDCLDKYRHRIVFDWNARSLIQRVGDLWTLYQERDIWDSTIERVLKQLLGWDELIAGLDNLYNRILSEPIQPAVISSS